MEIDYYKKPTGEIPVALFLDSLSPSQQTKVLRIFHYIREFGLASAIPHLKKLTGYPLWEIRILGKDNIRILCAIEQPKTVIILHGFIKKSQKTPMRELTITLKRYQNQLNRGLDI